MCLLSKIPTRTVAENIHSFRGRNRPALQTYTSLPAHYNPHQWYDLEAYSLLNSLENYKRIGSGRDREWLHTALAYMKSYVTGLKKNLLVVPSDIKASLKELVAEVCETASSLDAGM